MARFFRAVVGFVIAGCVCVFLGVLGPAAKAQTSDTLNGQEIDISVDSFGVGGGSRVPGWVPVRLSLIDYGTQARNVLVTFRTTDADGDIQAQSREVTLNPGLRAQVWMYLNLPDNVSRSDTWEVQAFEFTDGVIGRQLGARIVGAGLMADPEAAILGVIGQRDGGLADYMVSLQQQDPPHSANEITTILKGLRPGDLPDRWQGLAMFEALVWMPDEDPSGLGADAAGAIMEWVRRGGHLVIVMPSAGVAWKTTQLDAIMPPLAITRWEDQELDSASACGGLLRHISRFATIEKAPRPPFYPRITLTLFEPPGSGWESISAIPLMEVNAPLTDGTTAPRAIACQRIEGLGFVTLVGVPVTDTALNRPGLDLPSAEAFWNQILGRRQDTPAREELEAAVRRFAPSRSPFTTRLSGPFTEQMELDAARTGGALLLGVVIFVLYWLASGPPVYAILKKKSQLQHAWVAFLASAVIFTGIGWAGAILLRREQILPRHFTILDHVANGVVQHARTFINLPLDGYGSRRLEVGSSDEKSNGPVSSASGSLATLIGATVPKDPRWHNTITSFFPPGKAIAGFPDTRTYYTATVDQSAADVPARNTAKQVEIDWVGAPLDGWGMPNYTQDSERPQAVYRTVLQGEVQTSVVSLTGSLTHALPGPLHDVTIIHVTNRPSANSRIRPIGNDDGAPRLRAYSWARVDSWAPGEVLDLGDPAFKHDNSSDLWDNDGTINSLTGKLDSAAGGVMSGRTTFGRSASRQAFLLLSMFNQITPPAWATSNVEAPRIGRTIGRDLDLSEWLNRPCLIIMGYVHNSPLPTPLYVDGERITRVDVDEEPYSDAVGGSQTLVRWIYPMPVESQPR